MSRGCTCGHIACVCDILRGHIEGCKFRLSATCPVPIECKHGYDVCPECDPCTCEEVRHEQEEASSIAGNLS